MTGETAGLGGGSAVANLGFAYDVLGNLTERTDSLTYGSESFCYDNLNRLTHDKLASSINCTSDSYHHSVTYDALGNITSKTRLDNNSLANTYNYPSTGSALPHAVSSVTGLVNGILNPTYTYDANGALLSGANRTASWTVFDMVASITQGTTSVAYTYDDAHQRVTETTSVSGSATKTITYLNDPVSGVSEEKSVSGSTTTWTTYILAGGRRVAANTVIGTTLQPVKYFIADHLGSVSVVVNGSGAVLERLAYDPWGKRRNTDGSDDPTNSISSSTGTTRGFSDHEMIDDGGIGLVNMNARIYDPELGRFMSADSVVASIYMSQALNRFAYVQNNPLSVTDMDGNCGPFCIVAIVSGIASLFTHNSIIHTIAAIAIGVVFASPEVIAALGHVGAALVGGFIAGGVTGHSIQAALLGGLQGLAFAAAGKLSDIEGWQPGSLGRTLANGLAGGLVSEAEGGKFGSGFLAAGFSELASPIENIGDTGENAIMHAVVGGVASVLGGGKFASGAITAAFSYLYDDANLREELAKQLEYVQGVMSNELSEIREQRERLQNGLDLDESFSERFEAWFGKPPSLDLLNQAEEILKGALQASKTFPVVAEDRDHPCTGKAPACQYPDRIVITKYFYTLPGVMDQVGTLGHEFTHVAGTIDTSGRSVISAESWTCFLFGGDGAWYCRRVTFGGWPLILATAFLANVSIAKADDYFDPLFDGRQTHITAAAEVLSGASRGLELVVHLKNVSTFPLCVPTAFLPQDGRLTRRSLDVFDDRGELVKYLGVSNFLSPPFDVFLAIPIGYTADVHYFLGESFELEVNRKYHIRIAIDAFDCGVLAKGYVFPQWRPAIEWAVKYKVPAVDLGPAQMFTFDVTSSFVAPVTAGHTSN